MNAMTDILLQHRPGAFTVLVFGVTPKTFPSVKCTVFHIPSGDPTCWTQALLRVVLENRRVVLYSESYEGAELSLLFYRCLQANKEDFRVELVVVPQDGCYSKVDVTQVQGKCIRLDETFNLEHHTC